MTVQIMTAQLSKWQLDIDKANGIKQTIEEKYFKNLKNIPSCYQLSGQWFTAQDIWLTDARCHYFSHL